MGPMKIIADLHLHSKYSRAVSKQMELPIMAEWAQKKGINLLATADWTHPLWLKEIESQLEEVEEGIFQLKDNKEVKFILSTEISSIYSQGGQVRRIHNLVLAPSFDTVRKINSELIKRGCNLMSDGRPIIGLSSMALAELVWSIDKKALIIPAHVWTPWFSLYGSKSGFDSIEECFGNFTGQILAIETGLSSDPAMNWRIKDLEDRSIVSFSDAHSPAKMGRELTIFDLEKLSFSSLSKALDLKEKSNNRILYTIEFYPEEGKYHYSGHRNCGVTYGSEDVEKKGMSCPVCGRPLTLGVMYRVDQLAEDNKVELAKQSNNSGLLGIYNKNDKSRPPYVMLVPLLEIIAEALSSTVSSQRVKNEYEKLIKSFKSEFEILTQINTEEIILVSNPKIAEGIDKVRQGNIVIKPGFDGVFGIVKIWQTESENQDLNEQKEQMALFS